MINSWDHLFLIIILLLQNYSANWKNITRSFRIIYLQKNICSKLLIQGKNMTICFFANINHGWINWLKNIFVFLISKSEIERHKQLNKNEEINNLELFLRKIKLDYYLDFLIITSQDSNSYIITSYIEPSLYKENIL